MSYDYELIYYIGDRGSKISCKKNLRKFTTINYKRNMSHGCRPKNSFRIIGSELSRKKY